jgi:dihydrodipicolinate synthase/N-acetylneuraminate lyase
MMQARDYQGLYGIIATPTIAGGDRLDAEHSVDLAETERLVERLLADGVSGLIVCGTTGECATLSEPDYEAFTACVLETVRRRVPTFVGATAMGGHQVVRRLRRLQQLGADGTLLGLPMWQPLSVPGAVDFYAGISSLFPELTIMVYANARAFRFGFGPDFWAAVAKAAPAVTSAKYSNPNGLVDLIAATRGRIHFMPSDMAVHQFHALSPATTTSCWATAAGMNPLPSLALIQALRAGDGERARQLATAIGWANAPVMPIVSNAEVFAMYNIQVEKERINAAGYSRAGPVRPPYHEFPAPYAEAARECGRRWARLSGILANRADDELNLLEA